MALVIKARAAVDMKALSGDEAAVFGGQKKAYTSHFIDIGHASDRLQGGDAFQGGLWVLEACGPGSHKRCVDVARKDGIDPDTKVRAFEGKRLGKRQLSSLAGRVSRRVSLA